jgi:hypothetical protein
MLNINILQLIKATAYKISFYPGGIHSGYNCIPKIEMMFSFFSKEKFLPCHSSILLCRLFLYFEYLLSSPSRSSAKTSSSSSDQSFIFFQNIYIHQKSLAKRTQKENRVVFYIWRKKFVDEEK